MTFHYSFFIFIWCMFSLLACKSINFSLQKQIKSNKKIPPPKKKRLTQKNKQCVKNFELFLLPLSVV